MAKSPLMTYSMNSFPLGQNSVQRINSDIFQLPNPESMFPEKGVPQLTRAVNIDIDNFGVPRRRAGTLTKVNAADIVSSFSGAGLLLIQEANTLYSVNSNTYALTVLVADLGSTDRLSYTELANQVFYTNGIIKGRIDADGNALNWGCATAPIPTLGTTSGSLRSGRYMVTATFVDTSGIEHTASKAGVITIGYNKAITVDITSTDSYVSSVKLYCTGPNQSGLFFVKEVALANFPTTITDVEVSTEQVRTQHLSPPIPADVLFSYRGMLILGIEDYIFPSLGLYHHLYEVQNTLQQYPATVKAGAGLDNGFWVVTAEGAFWTSGNIPSEWNYTKKDSRKYASGVLIKSGTLFPKLETSEEVAFFVSEDGLVAGLPNGDLLPITQDKLKINVDNKRASIIYREVDQFRQLLFTLNKE